MSVFGSADQIVDEEIRQLGYETFYPTFRLEFFHRRHTTVETRTLPLLPGYLLADTQTPSHVLSSIRHARNVRLFPSSHPLPDDRLAPFRSRVEAGEFDVHLTRIPNILLPKILPPVGARVRVQVLDLVGSVLTIIGKFAEVLLDSGRLVKVRAQCLDIEGVSA